MCNTAAKKTCKERSMTSINEYVNVLRKSGLRATAQRIEILNILTQGEIHPTAEEVYHKARKKFPTISAATVYKTIQALKEAGRVQQLAFYGDKARFEANTEPHINLVCLRCGRIQDVFDPRVNEFIKQFSNRSSFKVESQRIDLYGACKHCR
jgi:Fur family peroxide stress response transcriptional regulator